MMGGSGKLRLPLPPVAFYPEWDDSRSLRDCPVVFTYAHASTGLLSRLILCTRTHPQRKK